MRLPVEIDTAINQMRARYSATKGTPSIRHKIGQELAAQFPDYVFEVTAHHDSLNEIVICVWPANEYLQRRVVKR